MQTQKIKTADHAILFDKLEEEIASIQDELKKATEEAKNGGKEC